MRNLLVGAMVAVCGTMTAPSLHAETPSNTGTVTGSIRFHRATVQAEGPKHDRDVVVSLDPVARAGDEYGLAHD